MKITGSLKTEISHELIKEITGHSLQISLVNRELNVFLNGEGVSKSQLDNVLGDIFNQLMKKTQVLLEMDHIKVIIGAKSLKYHISLKTINEDDYTNQIVNAGLRVWVENYR